MAQSININTGEITVLINGDESRAIVFNPNDLSFLESFCDLLEDFEKKEKEFKNKELALNANKDVDSRGIPQNIKGKIALNREICLYMREKIDTVFGAGASDTAFGEANTVDMFVQFFDGIAHFIKSARSERTAKYLNRASQEDAME